jgi:hypothetical protein
LTAHKSAEFRASAREKEAAMADSAADVEAHAGGAKQTIKDLSAGAAGGVAQVLIGKFLPFVRFGVAERVRMAGLDECLLW